MVQSLSILIFDVQVPSLALIRLDVHQPTLVQVLWLVWVILL
ncbi:MAG: hypothetical protein RIS47_2354 [Bacteroidota bacterium]|jgi:hypothetical protein